MATERARIDTSRRRATPRPIARRAARSGAAGPRGTADPGQSAGPACGARVAALLAPLVSPAVKAPVAARTHCSTTASASASPARARVAAPAPALRDFGIDRSDLIEAQERNDVLGLEQRIGWTVVAADGQERVESHVAARILPFVERKIPAASRTGDSELPGADEGRFAVGV